MGRDGAQKMKKYIFPCQHPYEQIVGSTVDTSALNGSLNVQSNGNLGLMKI